jgi:hypothetical protein
MELLIMQITLTKLITRILLRYGLLGHFRSAKSKGAGEVGFHL